MKTAGAPGLNRAHVTNVVSKSRRTHERAHAQPLAVVRGHFASAYDGELGLRSARRTKRSPFSGLRPAVGCPRAGLHLTAQPGPFAKPVGDYLSISQRPGVRL